MSKDLSIFCLGEEIKKRVELEALGEFFVKSDLKRNLNLKVEIGLPNRMLNRKKLVKCSPHDQKYIHLHCSI